jgi:hypothetical protein
MVSPSKHSFPLVAALILGLMLALKASAPADQTLYPPAGGEFGSAADIQGNIAVIGNPYIGGTLGMPRGVVYIMERGPAGWQLVKTLLPPVTGDSFTRFGAEVTLAGNRLAVSDPHYWDTDLAEGHTGRVYIYEKQGAIWPDQPAYVIAPSQPNVSWFGQAQAFSGEYLAVTELISFDSNQPDQSVVRVRSFRLQNGQATLLGTIERTGGDSFGFAMSMHGSELAILNARKGMLLPPKEGTVFLYDLSGGTMRQTVSLRVPMKEGDFFSSPKIKLEGDQLLVSKIAQPSAGVVIFKRTRAGWRATSEIRPPQPGELTDYLIDMAGNSLVSNNGAGTDLYTTSDPPRFVRRLVSEGTYGLATSIDTAMIVRSDEVVFTSLRSLVAADSVVVDPAQARPPGGVIDLGVLVAGQASKVEVELQNASAEPLQLTGVQITPVTGANSLTEHSFTPATLPALGKTRVKLTLNPPSAGSYQMSLTVLHPDSAQAPYSYTLTFEASASDFAPSVSETAGSILAAKGEAVKLQTDATGPRGRFNCQWYKDGREIKGSTQPFLFIPSAQAPDAGRYRLDVWSASTPRMSCAMNLGVFERHASSVLSRADESISLTARFWGPGIRVRWLSGYHDQLPIAETWTMQGTQSATLRIPSPVALAGAGPTRIRAELVMDDVARAISNDHVVELIRVPIIAVTGTRYGRVGEPFGPLSLSDLTEHYEGVYFSAEGLPPGVTVSSGSYEIKGTPTRAGNYAVKIMAENRYGNAAPLKLNLKIYSATEEPQSQLHFGIPSKTAGIIMMPVANSEAPEWPGLLQVQTTTGRGFSGSLAFGSVHLPFSGKWTVKPSESSRSTSVRLGSFLGFRSAILKLSQTAVDESYQTNGITATLILNLASPEPGSVERETSLDPLILPNKDWSGALAGRYSFLLGGLEGQGFGSLIVGTDFQATGVGTLADGTGFTFSIPMVKDQNERGGGTVMMVGLDTGTVRLWGQIRTTAAGINEAGLMNGTLRMIRPALPGARLLPDGYNTEVPVRGGRYFVPKGTPLFRMPENPVEQAGKTPINFTAGGLSESINTLVTFNKNGAVTVDQPNISDLKVDLYVPTGFFTGSFKINEPVLGAENRFVRRTVFYRGMVIPQRPIGGGFFHFSPLPSRFAEPPTTSGTTPIYIGGVSLE